MKKFLLLILGICLISCSDSYVEDVAVKNSSAEMPSKHKISKEKAVEIANSVLNHSSLTKGELAAPSFDYVFKSATKSNSAIPDTLAYIINYPNGNGFVIVSGDNRVYPVLAYSETGNFSSENEIVQRNFIDRIENYIDSNSDSDYSYDVSENSFETCHYVDPFITTGLHQGDPFNSYVVEEHPGCPAGCVAVATALVMSHATLGVTYHDEYYDFSDINAALTNGPENNTSESPMKSSIPTPIVPIVPTPTLTYEEAVDYMAKLLYWIGDDVNMTYATGGSSASSYNAYILLRNLGYDIVAEYQNFDINEISWHLNDNCIVYLVGYDYDYNGETAGHAWVSDGCRFCVDLINDPTEIIETYIHCNWGWGGGSDGYYSGSVFTAGPYDFSVSKYFAVKRTNQSDLDL